MSEQDIYKDTSAAHVRPKMASSSKREFKAPNIPETPSKTINSMLERRCNHPFDNPIKAGVAYFICGVFQGITLLYTKIKAKSQVNGESHRMWSVSCGVVSVAIVLTCYLVYKLILACSFLMYGILYYSSLAVALTAIGLGVSGAVFFDKDGTGRSTSGAERTAESVYSSSAYSSARQRIDPQ